MIVTIDYKAEDSDLCLKLRPKEHMDKLLKILRHDYQSRLKTHNIPKNPAQRTPEQEQTAALEFWAVMVPATALKTTTQASLEI